MTEKLYTPEGVIAMIQAGDRLLLAGDASLLAQMPKGNWIGGTTPFFILYPEQLVTSFDRIFVSRLPDFVEDITIMEYDRTSIQNVFCDGYRNGFTVLLIPFGSEVSHEYALNAPNYPNFAALPVCGWFTGLPLDRLMTEKSFAASGIGPVLHADKAVAMHIALPPTKYAEIHIFNPFTQGTGDVITFDYTSQTVREAVINGKKCIFADYLREKKIDLQMPLVANYAGAMININCIGMEGDEAYLSAPVFEKIEYRFGEIDFSLSGPELISDRFVLSVTCVINFFQPELCHKYLKKVNGPVVFGEIAYQLLNQTTMYLTIDDATP